ncbi:MAG TPA: FHA domain-containing protein [Polyangiaceae bacterium]|nr:FHA domain-containing protein [Polyangiaceae bacterium]
MATLKQLNGSKSVVLEAASVVGRARGSTLLISEPHVSNQHTLLRWKSNHWELRDRSHNGTYVNGVRLPTDAPRTLVKGDVLAFGDVSREWVFIDDSPPCVMLVATDGTTLIAEDDLLGVPSPEHPELTIFCDSDGVWKLEANDGATSVLENGTEFTCAGQKWRFCCPQEDESTLTAEHIPSSRQNQAEASPVLHFLVSADEEYVELRLEYDSNSKVVHLGARNLNYLLLVLARARIEDMSRGLPDTSCGWMYKEDLATSLHMTPTQIDGEVFRIRHHFARFKLKEAALVIERRGRTGQLRIGLRRLRITKL